MFEYVQNIYKKQYYIILSIISMENTKEVVTIAMVLNVTKFHRNLQKVQNLIQLNSAKTTLILENYSPMSFVRWVVF